MHRLFAGVLFAAVPSPAQHPQPWLDAAVVPGATDAVVTGVSPGSLCALVLGIAERPWPLPGGVALGIEPAVVAGLGVADALGIAHLGSRFPVGSGAGLGFFAQAIALLPGVPVELPGALVVTPLRSLQVPAAGAVADIVVLFGQSNMEGQAAVADLPLALRAPLPAARIWNDNARALQALAAGVNNTTLLVPTWAGPELALASDLCQGGRMLHFVKFAVNATALGPTPGPWNEWDCRSGELYVELLRRLDAAVACARALGLQPRVRAICMMQGESDALDPVLAAGYQARLVDLIGQLRSDLVARGLAARADVPFVLGLVNRGLLPLGAVAVDAVRAAQMAAAATEVNCAVVETTDLPCQPDGVHFATAGVCMLGERFAQVLVGFGLRP